MFSILLTVVLSAPPQAPRPPQAPPVSESPPTYAECCAKAKATGLPLIVWTGSAVCPGCVHALSAEAVHHVTTTFPGVPATGGIVVAVPDGQGGLDRVSDISWWVTGDATYGHTASVRRALTRWRQSRLTTLQAAPAAQPATGFGGLLGVPAPSLRVAPANFGRPVMSFRRGGG